MKKVIGLAVAGLALASVAAYAAQMNRGTHDSSDGPARHADMQTQRGDGQSMGHGMGHGMRHGDMRGHSEHGTNRGDSQRGHERHGMRRGDMPMQGGHEGRGMRHGMMHGGMMMQGGMMQHGESHGSGSHDDSVQPKGDKQ